MVFPNYFLPARGAGRGGRAVIIHDSQFKQFPQYFSTRKQLWLDYSYKRTLNLADRIFFISHFELEQATRYFGDKWLARAKVIYNAIDAKRFGVSDGRRAVVPGLGAEEYLLSVCHHFPHKNVETLIKAFAILRHQGLSHHLVLVGRRSEALNAMVRDVGPTVGDTIHATGFISDEEVGRLYRHASVFAMPSRYEGFGMPAIEAMHFQRRIVVSGAGALPEITGSLTRVVPETAGPERWASEILEALEDKIVPDYSEVVTRFSPTAVAQRVITSLD